MSRIRDIANILSGVSTDMATDAEVTSSIASHAAAADPHTVYLKESEFNAAGKNFLINGNMDFFQRGSLSTSSQGYGLDRWYQISSGSGANVSITQQSTGVPSGSRYCARVTMGASNGYGNQYQFLETSSAALLWGKNVTFSIKLRRSSSYNGDLNVSISKSATVDAGAGATWTNIMFVAVPNATLPTGNTSSDWYIASASVFIPNDGTTNSVRVSIEQNIAVVSSYWEMSQAQLEIGSTITPFSRAGGNLAGELAACQRYYYRWTPTAVYQDAAVGYNASANTASCVTQFPVEMRIAPTGVEQSGTASHYNVLHMSNGNPARTVCNAVPNFQSANKWNARTYFQVASGLTAGQGSMAGNDNNTVGYLGWSAEL